MARRGMALSIAVGHNPTPESDTLSAYVPTSDDLSLEAGIRAAYDATINAGTIEGQRQAFRSLSELVANRSLGMVAHLERQRGLR